MIRWVKATSLVALAFAIIAAPTSAQTASEAAAYNKLLQQYRATRSSMSPAQRARVESIFQEFRASYGLTGSALDPVTPRVGTLSSNPYLRGSTSQPSSRYQTLSPSNPYGQYGSRYSPDGARNPYTTGGLDIVGSDGTYLGRLNSNRYDPNSVANPYGRYGSPYSSESVNNPYGRFGSPYSSMSARNPYATSAPGLYQPSRSTLSPRTTIRPLGGR